MLTSGLFGYIGDYLLYTALLVSLIAHTWFFFRFFPRKRKPKLSLIAGNMLVFCCLLGTVAFAAETYMRFAMVATDAFGVSLPARRWFALYTKLNSLGCRDEEWPIEKPLGQERIAFVGDSFTYGWGIERVEDRLTEVIQKNMDVVKPGQVKIMNVAKPGWDTATQLRRIPDIIRLYHVDEIVLCYVANDIEGAMPIDQLQAFKQPPQPKWFNPDGSVLVDWLYRRIFALRSAQVSSYYDRLADAFASQAIWSKQKQQLSSIAKLCQDQGVTFKVALLPFVQTGSTSFKRKPIHKQLDTFLTQIGVPHVDLLPTIENIDPSELVVNGADPHPNEKAQRLFAKAIFNMLR